MLRFAFASILEGLLLFSINPFDAMGGCIEPVLDFSVCVSFIMKIGIFRGDIEKYIYKIEMNKLITRTYNLLLK